MYNMHSKKLIKRRTLKTTLSCSQFYSERGTVFAFYTQLAIAIFLQVRANANNHEGCNQQFFYSETANFQLFHCCSGYKGSRHIAILQLNILQCTIKHRAQSPLINNSQSYIQNKQHEEIVMVLLVKTDWKLLLHKQIKPGGRGLFLWPLRRRLGENNHRQDLLGQTVQAQHHVRGRARAGTVVQPVH